MAAGEHDVTTAVEPARDLAGANGDRDGRPPMPVALPAGVPELVKIKPGMMLAPQEMRDLAAVTGRALSDVLAGEEDDLDAAPDRTQALVWTVLRRLGHDVTWDQAGRVAVEVGDALDPMSGADSTP